MNGVMRFGNKGRHSPRYIGPYRISRTIGNVTYELELPQELSRGSSGISYIDVAELRGRSFVDHTK